MRSFSPFACTLIAGLALGQTGATNPPNAVRLTKYVLGVADLDRSYAFYHALGLDLDGAATLSKPSVLPDPLLKLVDVPVGTKFRNTMLRIPGAAFLLEVTEFSNMDLHPVAPRVQDPGASLLVFAVPDIDAALASAKSHGGRVITAGDSPVAGGGPVARAVRLIDPDGYYVGLSQLAAGKAPASRAIFGSMVQDSEKAAAFYKDQFGLTVQKGNWTSDYNTLLGISGAQERAISAVIPGAAVRWDFNEIKGLDRKAYSPRIPDPGAPAIGLEVRDIDAVITAMKAAGGASITRGGSIKLGNCKVGFVRDPSGILVELTQR
jgi:predicted enzyme related to lactoylglutathione lyase